MKNALFNDGAESPLGVPTADSASPIRSNETDRDDRGRPFVVVDGRRYVLGDDEAPLDLGALPENPKLSGIPTPPRDVSTTAKLVLLFGASPTATFGWIWLCFSTLFAVVLFGALGLGAAFYEKIGSWAPFATARLVACEDANFSVNGKSAKIWRFEGTAPDGSTFQGRSYSFDSCEPGTDVEIERRAGTVDALRVRGTSISQGGTSTFAALFPLAFVSLFVFIGVCFALIGPIRRGRKALPLLRRGVAAQGVAVDVSATGTRVNNAPEMRVTYRFQTADGAEYEATARGFRLERLTDEPTEILLYDPNDPRKSLVFDELPRGVKLLPNGRFGASATPLLIPIIFATIFLGEIVATAFFACRFERATFAVESVDESADAPGAADALQIE